MSILIYERKYREYMQSNTVQYKPRKNYQIKAAQVRLIGSDGSNIGVVSLQEALQKAKDEGLDLVEINGKSVPVVCKVIDFGKMLYEEKKKQQIEKRKQQVQELKELTFKPNTDTNDLLHKLEQAKGFLSEGHRCKLVCRFRGREIVHSDIGRDKLVWILEQLSGLIVANPPISLDGKLMSVVVSPAKKQ